MTKPFLPNLTKRELASAVYQMASLQSRLGFSRQAGMQFDGRRDLYEVFGYKKEPSFDDFRVMYERNGLARRIVEAVADETWRKDPVLVDGEIKSNGTQELTPFLKGYMEIVDRLRVLQHFRNADINCGIGRWSLIYMGMAGAEDLQVPLAKLKGQAVDPRRLLYMATYDEGQVPEFKETDKEISSARYGQPVIYKVYPSGTRDVSGERLVHFSRVLHIAENLRRSPTVGVPRLQAVLNNLYDMEKVTGSAAEAFWLGVYQGFVFQVKDDYEVPKVGDAASNDLEVQIEAFVHRMNRYIMAEGLEKAEAIKSDVSSPNDHFRMLISLIAGATSIPQRILIGSERGELASDQDDKNFADFVDVRRTKFAEVQFIRPFVQFLIDQGLVPAPTYGAFRVEHQSLFELNEVERADVAYKVAQAIYVLTRNNPAAANSIPVDEFFKKYLGFAVDIRTGQPKGQKPQEEPDGTGPV